MENSRTVLFFDRCELTYLYGKMTPYMEGVKVIHVAYSQAEANILAGMGIKSDYIYLQVYKEEYDNCLINNELLNLIDEDIITYSKGRFTLNSSIQSDRAFTLLSYEECLHQAVAHYLSWKTIFQDDHIDMLLHEPCSLFFNHIAAILCNKQGGTFTYQIQLEGDQEGFSYLYANDDDFCFKEVKDKFNYYLKHPDRIDRERCAHFLERFRKEQKVFFGNIINRRQPLWKLYINAARSYCIRLLNRKDSDKKYNLIDYWLLSQNSAWEKIRNIKGYERNHIHFYDSIPDGEKFFFYPMHLEPEAVVLYLGDGLYKNQVKLIENVAAALPPGYYLYVKDHPHEFAYRSPDDYARLSQVPNIRLLSQWLPGKEIIKRCEGLVTINGTAGFEALLMGKQVYCFGQSHYSFHPRVNFIKNIRDFRNAVYTNIGVEYADDEVMSAYIMGYLKALHPGYTNFFLGTADKLGINQDNNSERIAKDLVSYIDYFK